MYPEPPVAIVIEKTAPLASVATFTSIPSPDPDDVVGRLEKYVVLALLGSLPLPETVSIPAGIPPTNTPFILKLMSLPQS